MSTNVAEEFSRIQDSALDSKVPLADTLRLCVALGGRLRSPELIAWAQGELNGNPPGEELPPYRRITAPLKMDYVYG